MRGKSLKFKMSANHWVKYIKTQWQFLLICSFFISGLVSGALTAGGYIQSGDEALGVIVSGFVSSRTGQAFGEIFLSSIFSSLPFIAAAFLSGVCAIGIPFVPIIAIARGVGIGISLGYFYIYYGINGILYCLLMIIPGAVIASTALLLACKQSLDYSYLLFCHVFMPNKRQDKAIDIRIYCMRYAVFAVMIILSAIIDACFASLFSDLFVF